jgi:N,N-dimethylformamidase
MADDLVVRGYTGEVSVSPGDSIAVMLSSSKVSEVSVDLVNLTAAGQPSVGDRATASIGPQQTQRGSWLESDLPPSAWGPTTDDGSVIWAFVSPTMPAREGQVVVGGWDDATGGIALAVSDGHAELWVGEAGSATVLRAPNGLRPSTWYLLVGAVTAETAQLRQFPVTTPYNASLAPYLEWDETVAEQRGDLDLAGVRPGPLRVGAAGVEGGVGHHFDGKIDLFGIVHGRLDDDLVTALLAGEPPRDRVVATWDPGVGLTPEGVGDVVVDVGPGSWAARGHNKPMRLVTGRTWQGKDDCYLLDPAQYSAVQFASDALTDCNWEPSAHLAVPSDCPSGVYAARVSADGTTLAELPVVVRASDPGGEVLVVLPTLTYIAESDDRGTQAQLGSSTPIQPGRPAEDFGGSTKDLHRDGSGVVFASRRRPMAELSAHARSRVLPGPELFATDMILLDFLRRRGVAFDVITDEELDRQGAASLRPYRAVLTGSRPEYATKRMLEAYEEYATQGGRLACFGAGAFYWVASIDPDDPAVIEVRRGESGARAWQIPPGEHYHATSGERGGLWRGRGRPPQKLLGVGHASIGFVAGVPYRRMPDSWHKSVSWVFDGVDAETFGGRSLFPGGAAGQVVDRYDTILGSPPHARILATSTRLPDEFQHAVEEVLFNHQGMGGREDHQVRGDMVLFTTPSGGAVFAAGSAGWCAALAVDDFDNDVARITDNVLRGFLRPQLPGQRFVDEDDLVTSSR